MRRVLAVSLTIGSMLWLVLVQFVAAHNGETHGNGLMPHRSDLLPLIGVVLVAGLGYVLIRRWPTRE